jgi:hypothetical protein
LDQINASYTHRSPVVSSIAAFPALAIGNAEFKVVCGLLGGFTLTSRTEPIIVTDVPEDP